MNAAGSDISPLTTNGDNETPDWSPDGTEIAFVSYHDPGNIPHLFTITPAGTGLKDISAVTDPSDQYYDQEPSWAPDSANLLVSSDRPSEDCCIQVFEIARDGSATKLVSDSVGNAVGPVFSPDGSSFAFTTNDGDGTNQVYVQSFGSNSYTAVSDGPDTAVGEDASWQATVHTVAKLSPTSGKAGAHVTVTLSGFGDLEPVALSFLDGGVRTSLGTVSTNDQGSVTTSVTVPSGAAAGAATITATGSASARTASAKFKVKS